MAQAERKWYEVRIVEYREVPTKVKEWKQVANRGNERDGGPQYGYVWSDGVEVQTVTRLEQRVEECDVKRVVCAVNDLEYRGDQ